MRTFLVCLLALAVILSPTAQAFACTCGETESVATGHPCCGCCGDAAACSCCAPGDDEQPAMNEDCPCMHTAPRAVAAVPAALAPPAAAGIVPVAATSRAAAPAAAPEGRTPHPEVVLPLLV